MINLRQKYKTRAGNPVELWRDDVISQYSIIGAIKVEQGWRVATWTSNGSYVKDEEDHRYDLIEDIPEIYAVILEDGIQKFHQKEIAQKHAKVRESQKNWVANVIYKRGQRDF